MSAQVPTSQIVMSMMLVWIGHFIVDFMLGIWPVYKTMVGLDLATAGLVMGMAAIVGESFQPFVGALSDRGHAKSLVLIGVMFAGSASFFAYTESFSFLGFLLLLAYVGSGVFHPAASGLVGSLLSNRRGLLMTIFASGGAVGLAVSQLVFTKAYIFLSGHTFYLLVPGLLLAAWAFFRRFQPVVVAVDPSPRDLGYKRLIKFFRNPELLRLYVMLVCNQGLMWAMIFLLPDVLKTRGYESWVYYGAGHLCFAAGGGLMLIPAGYLADRYSEKQVLLTGSLIACCAFYLFLALPLTAAGALALLFVLGACMYAVTPLSIALGIRLVPSEPGRVSAFLMGMVWVVSEGLGPSISGFLTRFFTDYAAAKSLSCMGLLFSVSIYCISRLPLPESRPSVAAPLGSVQQ